MLPKIDGYDIILGFPWIVYKRVMLLPHYLLIKFIDLGITVTTDNTIMVKRDIQPIGAPAFTMWQRRQHHTRHTGIQVFAASMKDIDKALHTKTYSDPWIKLPKHYHEFLQVFDQKEADKLAPHWGPQDHHIEQIVSKETR